MFWRISAEDLISHNLIFGDNWFNMREPRDFLRDRHREERWFNNNNVVCSIEIFFFILDVFLCFCPSAHWPNLIRTKQTVVQNFVDWSILNYTQDIQWSSVSIPRIPEATKYRFLSAANGSCNRLRVFFVERFESNAT